MTESEAVTKYAKLIRYHGTRFMRERHMPYQIYVDDVLQEATIGFISWWRKMEAGGFGPDGEKYIGTSIRFHLYKAFLHERGIHRSSRAPCKVRVLNESDAEFPPVEFEDPVYKDDVERWMKSLRPDDRIVVEMWIKGYPPREIEKRTAMKDYQYRYRKERIARSYRDYFRGAT